MAVDVFVFVRNLRFYYLYLPFGHGERHFAASTLVLVFLSPLVEMIKGSREGWWSSKLLIKFSLTPVFSN